MQKCASGDLGNRLVHEMVHALGRHHPDSGVASASIMRISDPTISATPGSIVTPGHILHPFDIDALTALHDGRIDEGDDANTAAVVQTALGTWTQTANHLLERFSLGSAGRVAFGAAERNGHVTPWGQGIAPATRLEDNAVLSGGATWSGVLTGFEIAGSHRRVIGVAILEIDLSTTSPSGDLDFTGQESWTGAPGT